MNIISAQNLFKNIEFQGPCDLNNDTVDKVFRTRELLETLLKPENAAACELDAGEKRDFFNFYRDIRTGLKVVDMLRECSAFYTPMTATWMAMSKEIDEYFDANDGLKAAYQALLDAEIRFMEE